LIENNYDEYGEIYIYAVNFAEWYNFQQYQNLAHSVSPFQLHTILFFIGVSLALFIYSCYLNHKLKARMPWTPYTHGRENLVDYLDYGYKNSASEAGRLSRLNSGIVMMRSRSPADASTNGDFVGATMSSQGDAASPQSRSMLSQGDTQIAAGSGVC
jgi:hypothetical protein